MEALTNLKEKVELLVTLVKELKKENSDLLEKEKALQAQNDELRTENAKIVENIAQLEMQISSLESISEKENGTLKELSKERTEAKAAVENLIKSIDVLVEHEV